jgi:hypothetical protein
MEGRMYFLARCWTPFVAEPTEEESGTGTVSLEVEAIAITNGLVEM